MFATGSFGQSLVQYTLAPYNGFIYNPAKAGLDKGNIFLHHKSQYVGISPINFSNQSIAIDLPIYKIKSGMGIIVHNDFAGYLANTSMQLFYAYHVKKSKSSFSAGLGLGIHHIYLNGSKLRVASGDYDFGISHNDKILDNGNVSSIAFDADFGLNYQWQGLSVGLAVKNLLGHGNTIFNNNTLNTNRSFVGLLSYHWKLSEQLILTPNAVFKTDLIKSQLSLGGNFNIKQNYYAGFALVGYNSNNFDGLGLNVGAKLTKKIKIVYNYDIPLNALKGTNEGSHELLFQYQFDVKNKVMARYFINYNSRYL